MSLTLRDEFQKASKDVKNLKKRPTDRELLELYALFKQATVGDNNEPRPGMFNLKDQAKYDSWASMKGKINLDLNLKVLI